MASKYVVQAEEPNRTQSNRYLDATGHWTVPAGGGGGGASSLADLDDVSLTNVQDGETLVYDASSQKFINAEGTGGASSLEDLDDVEITTPTNGQALVYDSTEQKFVNETIEIPDVFTQTTDGLVPAPNESGNTKYLCQNGQWIEIDADIETITYAYYLAHKTELEQSGKPYIVEGSVGGNLDASKVDYNNTTSGLTAENVQGAIDEIVTNMNSNVNTANLNNIITVTSGSLVAHWNDKMVSISGSIQCTVPNTTGTYQLASLPSNVPKPKYTQAFIYSMISNNFTLDGNIGTTGILTLHGGSAYGTGRWIQVDFSYPI